MPFFLLNFLKQTSHLNFFPSCICTCSFKWHLWTNCLPHWLQTCGRLLVCTCIVCNFNSFVVQNKLSHGVHLCDFSTVCSRMWTFRLLLWPNDFPQSGQENGLSPVCVRLCVTKSPRRANDLLQTSHTKGFSPVCVRMCWSNFDGVGKIFSQYSHWCFIFFFVFCVACPEWLLSPCSNSPMSCARVSSVVVVFKLLDDSETPVGCVEFSSSTLTL